MKSPSKICLNKKNGRSVEHPFFLFFGTEDLVVAVEDLVGGSER